MPDRILLKSIEFYGHHGASEEERRIGHHFSVDVALELDLGPAGRSDNPADTVDYAEVYQRVLAVGQGAPARLLERLAEQISQSCLDVFPTIRAVEVAVRKRLPPLPGNVSAAEVRIRRARRRSSREEEE